MRRSINTKIITVVLAITCVLAFSISAAIVGSYKSTKDDSNAVVQDNGFDGLRGGEKSAQLGTAISTADQLRSWLNGSNTHGYLTNHITNWNKPYNKAELNLSAGRVLDGDGWTIIARTNDNAKIYRGDAVFGYLVDRNFGTIRNLYMQTANHVGRVTFSGQSNITFASSGFQMQEDGTITMGVVAGLNQGVIDNCVIDINHYIQNTWDDTSNMHWNYAALGGVVGANYTRSVNNGIISNTVVNLNSSGGLMVGVYAKRAGAVMTGGRSRVAAIAGMSNTTNGSIVSFKNNTVNFNGGIISTAACDLPGETRLYAAGVTTTVSINNFHDQGVNSEAPRVEGLLLNGSPDYRNLWNTHGERQAAFTVLQSDASREKNVYISDGFSFKSEVINNGHAGPAHGAKWYTLPNNSLAKFEGDKVRFTRRNLNMDQIIFTVHGQNVWEQQMSQIGSTEKIVKFNPKTANGQRVALDISMGRTENITTLSYDARTRVFDNKRHDARFRNRQGVAITVLTGGPTISYSGGNLLAGEHRATYTPGGNNVVGVDNSAKILYLATQSLTASMTITPKVLTMNYNFNDVYDSYLQVSGLIGEATIWVNSYEYTNSRLNFVQWGYYTIEVGNDNYVMPEGFPTEDVEISGRVFRADSRLKLAQDLPNSTVEMGYGGIFVKKKIDTIKLTALSNKYGSKFTEITGAVNTEVQAINSSYTAVIALNKDIVSLGLKQVNLTVSAKAETNNNAYGTVKVSNTSPTIGDSLTFTASANVGYTFLGWTESGKYISFNATYVTLAGAQGKTLKAVFANKCNVIIRNGSREVGKLSLTEQQLAKLPGVGRIISVAEAGLGEAATLAVNRQAYNDFYGWVVVSIRGGVYTLQAIYTDAVETVEVVKDHIITDYTINSDVTLYAGNYTVNGVAISVNNVTTLKAMAGLTIVTNGMSTKQANATGEYNADSKVGGVLQVNAVVAEGAKISIELVNNATLDSVKVAAVKGRKAVRIGGGKDIVQAILKIDPGFLAYADGEVVAKVYADNELIGTIAIREA